MHIFCISQSALARKKRRNKKIPTMCSRITSLRLRLLGLSLQEKNKTSRRKKSSSKTCANYLPRTLLSSTRFRMWSSRGPCHPPHPPLQSLLLNSDNLTKPILEVRDKHTHNRYFSEGKLV